jgi:hypothetical protein
MSEIGKSMGCIAWSWEVGTIDSSACGDELNRKEMPLRALVRTGLSGKGEVHREAGALLHLKQRVANSCRLSAFDGTPYGGKRRRSRTR